MGSWQTVMGAGVSTPRWKGGQGAMDSVERESGGGETAITD